MNGSGGGRTPVASRALRRWPDRVSEQVPIGCPACRVRPVIWLIGDDDPEPPSMCLRCGRESATETRMCVGVRLADV